MAIFNIFDHSPNQKRNSSTRQNIFEYLISVNTQTKKNFVVY